MPKIPDSAWLKSHFRVENLETPHANVLAAIEHDETRTFLSTVGFPTFFTHPARLTSRYMSNAIIDTFWLMAADIRDENPPTLMGNYVFLGIGNEFQVSFGTVKGDVVFCVFEDMRAQDKHLSLGSAATSVSSFLVLLGTFVKFRQQVQEVIDLCTPSELQPRLHIYKAFLRRVYERMREYGDLPERYDSFWHDICGSFDLHSPFFRGQQDNGQWLSQPDEQV